MSFITDKLKELPFYIARPNPCPYLDAQVEQKVFTRLLGDPVADQLLLNQLTPLGFRRSQNIIYRPACPSCMACVPVRIALAHYRISKNLKRIHARNRDLTRTLIPARDAEHLFDLFTTYQHVRHNGGDMAQMGKDDFKAMMNEGAENAQLLCLSDANGNVIAAMLMDRLNDGVSAVYSFFDPTHEKRSLGTELILQLIDDCQEKNLAFVYLGYWIKDCQKMAYKSRFPALQRLTADGWMDFTAD